MNEIPLFQGLAPLLYMTPGLVLGFILGLLISKIVKKTTVPKNDIEFDDVQSIFLLVTSFKPPNNPRLLLLIIIYYYY